MTTRKLDIIESMPLCGGELHLAHRHRRLTHYEHAASSSTDLSVWFVAQGRRTGISRLEDLRKIMNDRKCALRVWVEDHESVFAQILAPVLDFGRVVSSADLYSFLEEKYGVPVSSNLPRLDGAKLRFLCGTFGQAQEPTIVDVTLDLESLALSARPIVTKS